MASITGSNSNAPYSNWLLTDSNYTVTTTTFPASGTSASMASLSFPNYEPPTSGKFAIAISNTLTNFSQSAGVGNIYVGLQDSTDNVTFKSIGTLTGSLLYITSGSTSTTAPVVVHLNPVQKLPTYYVRGLITADTGATLATGSVTVQALF